MNPISRNILVMTVAAGAATVNIVFVVVFLSIPAIAQGIISINNETAANQTKQTAQAPRRLYPLGYSAGSTVNPNGNVARLYPLGYNADSSKQVQNSHTGTTKAIAQNIPNSTTTEGPNNILPIPFVGSGNISGGPAFIRVGLALNVCQANVVALDDLEIRNCITGACMGVLPSGTAWNVSDTGSELRFTLLDLRMGLSAAVNLDSKTLVNGITPLTLTVPRIGSFTVPIDAQAASIDKSGYIVFPRVQEGLVGLNGKAYRGALWLHISGTGTFSAINFVGIEDYLLSVVPSEMPSSWPIEALKAQSIAARSYALANLSKHGIEGYDVKATVEDQVYSGVMSESSSGNQAVAETGGIVLKNQGKIVPAFYHSTSGGATETADYVWGKSYPFLQEVIDYDDASPKFTWTKKVPLADLNQGFRGGSKDIGSVQGITVLTRAPSNHNMKILVTGSQGTRVITGEEARGILNLPSSTFNVFQDSNFFIFSGRGFGHGLGLSQWGAKALAGHGYNAAQILSYYYKDVFLDYP